MGRHGRHPSDSTADWGRIVELVGPDPNDRDPLERADLALADVRVKGDALDELEGPLARAMGSALDAEHHYWETVKQQANRALDGRPVKPERIEGAGERRRLAHRRLVIEELAAEAGSPG